MKKEEVKQERSVADEIWDDIRKLEAPMFALPPVPVESLCSRIDIEPSKLYLKIGVPSLLPMLEELVGKKYDIAMGKLYCEVSRKSVV